MVPVPISLQQIVATPGMFSRMYAAVNEVGVIKSTDAGLTWSISAADFALSSDVNHPTTGQLGLAGRSVRTEIAISPSHTARIYAAVERPRGVGDIYMSKDAGNSWVLIPDTSGDPNWFNGSGRSGATGAYTSGWFTNTISVHPYDPKVLFVGGTLLYRIDVNFSDNTRTSTLAGFLNGSGGSRVHPDHHWLQPIPLSGATKSFRLLNANDSGVAFSNDDGASWTQLGGMVTTQFYGVDKKPGENIYLGGTQDNGTWRSTDNPDARSTWIKELGGDGFEVAWHRDNRDLALATIQFGLIHRSEDGGQTWTRMADATAGTGPFITKIGYSKTDPDLVFSVGTGGIKRSDDFGVTWTLTTIDGNWLGYRPFDNVEIANGDPRVVWISSRMDVDPETLLRGGIHVSSDGGLSFKEISANFPATVNEASGIAVHPYEPKTAYFLFSAAGVPKILKTTDLGVSFEDLSGFAAGQDVGFPDVAVFDLMVMPFDDRILWAATEIGLFISEDGGSSWEYADNGMPHVAIFQMKIIEDQVVASTQGLGVWTVTLAELAGNKPPDVTLTPVLAALATSPSGNVAIDVDLRSPYDRVEIRIEGESTEILPANDSPQEVRLLYPIFEETELRVQVVAYKGDEAYLSPLQQVSITPADPRRSYSNDFDDPNAATDFTGSGFSVYTASGFDNGAIHSTHFYAESKQLVYGLQVPLVVPDGNAVLSFDEVVLVEPGTANSRFGDANFWDFVIVEGTRDGHVWVPLLDGYDSRQPPIWTNTYNSGGSGNKSHFQNRAIDISETFAAGDTILLRFRLEADSSVNGWGWAIDNLEIFADQAASDAALAYELVYPWISQNENFSSVLVVNNPGNQAATVTLTARRETGIGQKVGPLTIPAHGFLASSELFGEISPGSGFTVTLRSDRDEVRGRWVTNDLQATSQASPSQGVAVSPGTFEDVDNARAGKRLLFGYLPLSDGFISAPVVVNLDDSPADVTFSFYTADGSKLHEQEQTLEALDPGKPFARIANDLIPDAEEDVYLIAETSGASITGVVFVFNGEGETAIGNASSLDVPAAAQSSELVYPWISSNSDFESLVIVNNPGADEANVSMIARRENGDTQRVERTIKPFGFLRETATTLFDNLGTDSNSGYSVRLLSKTPGLRGRWVTSNPRAASGRSPSQGVAINVPNDGENPSQRAGNRILFGYLPVTDGLVSAPVIVNIGAAAADVILEYYNESGDLVLRDPESLRGLAPHTPFARVANEIVGETQGNLQLIATCDSALITGVAFVFNSALEPAIGNVTALDLVMAEGKQALAPYSLPYPAGASYPLSANFATETISCFAYGFHMPANSPILAARTGTVIAANDAFQEDGKNRLLLLHDDGSVAHYMGLNTNSLVVHLGERVIRGERLAGAGQTTMYFAVSPTESQQCTTWPMPLSFRNMADSRGILTPK